MIPSFLITFREGLEAFLLVGIILAYLDKLNARKYNPLVYLGVGLGLVASLGLAFAFQLLVDEFENETYRNIAMICILLFAVLLLTYLMVWMKDQAKNLGGKMQEELQQMVDSRNLTGLISLAFLAILREGWETVLFFSALIVSGDETSMEVGLAGGALGLLASWLLVAVLMKSSKRIPLGLFFKYSSLLILLIAAGLLASCVNMMQAVEWLPVLIHQLFNIAHILDDHAGVGVFLRALFGYNSSPTLIQFTVWVLYLGAALFFWKKTYAEAK